MLLFRLTRNFRLIFFNWRKENPLSQDIIREFYTAILVQWKMSVETQNFALSFSFFSADLIVETN
jgi:hypothetical protein